MRAAPEKPNRSSVRALASASGQESLASVLTRLRAAGAPRLPPVVAASASFLTPETAMAAFQRYVEIAPVGFARSTSAPP